MAIVEVHGLLCTLPSPTLVPSHERAMFMGTRRHLADKRGPVIQGLLTAVFQGHGITLGLC